MTSNGTLNVSCCILYCLLKVDLCVYLIFLTDVFFPTDPNDWYESEAHKMQLYIGRPPESVSASFHLTFCCLVGPCILLPVLSIVIVVCILLELLYMERS
jgi:hypothetical protein